MSSALTKINAKERCRTCLSKLIKNEVSLEDVDSGKNFVCVNSNPELRDLLDKYVGIEGDEETNQDKDYPASVCISCMRQLQHFEAFRNKALDSAEKLFRVFRGTDECKIELDDNGVSMPCKALQVQLKTGKEAENDIFNLLLKDSLMETEAILLDGVESDNVINNMDPDPFQTEIDGNKRKCRKTKRKEDSSLPENHNKSNRKRKRIKASEKSGHDNKDDVADREKDHFQANLLENSDKGNEIDCEVKVKELDEDYEDWQHMDFHTNDDNDSSDNEVLSKKIQNSRKVLKKTMKKAPKTEPGEEYEEENADSDSDFVLESMRKSGEIKKSPNDTDDMHESEFKDLDDYKTELESDSISSESDFEVKTEKKQKSSFSPGKRSAASGRKKGLTNSHKCDQCNRRFAHKVTLDAHVRKIHQGEKRAYKCELCDKSYSFMGGLSTHMRETHERQEEAYSCKIPGCDKKYTSYITLQRHVRVKHLMSEVPTRFVCEQCGATFKQTSNLRYHMRTRHPTEDDLKQKEIIKERLECEICKKSFNSQYTLKYHKLRIHADDKKYECKICGRRVAKKFMLDQHMLVHSEDKTACKFCGREFVRKYQVEAHIKAVHQKLKPFQCSHCSESFASRKTLRHHVYIHTGEKPYVCDICGQAYRQPTCLKNHRKIHNKANSSNTSNNGNINQEPDGAAAAAAAAAIANRNFINTLMQGNENVMDGDALGLN
uniref:Protein krueppel n=1 Tax=Stomoxys calcitrans TaxID=35570 RepID=A0A1I8NZV4_STOCA